MEKKHTAQRKRSLVLVLIIILNMVYFYSCNEIKNEDKLENAINFSKSNFLFLDTLANLQKDGVQVMNCHVRTDSAHLVLNYSVIHSVGDKPKPLKITTDFRLELINGIYILFKDPANRQIAVDKKFDKDILMLIDKGIYTFDGPPTFYDPVRTYKFVLCKDNPNIYKFLDKTYLDTEEKKARKDGRTFDVTVLYPNCK